MYLFMYGVKCDQQSPEDALLKCVMVTPEEVIKSSLDPEGATFSRNETIYLAFKQFSLYVYL